MNTLGTVWSKSQRKYVQLCDNELREEKPFVPFRRKESKHLQEYLHTHKYGYCKKCGMLVALNGRCSNGCDE